MPRRQWTWVFCLRAAIRKPALSLPKRSRDSLGFGEVGIVRYWYKACPRCCGDLQMQQEIEERRVPVILFTKGGGLWLEEMAETGCDAVGVDWTVDLGEARRRIGKKVALQGNMDPCALYASSLRVRQEVSDLLAAYGAGSGHVFNLGHGIHPSVDPEKVAVLVEAVHELSAPYHS
jgi:uroporphyrinogen-III decarboxylase